MENCLLSIIVVFYNGRREAERTLYTLSKEYQEVDSSKYKVIVLDSNSSSPLNPSDVYKFGENYEYHYVKSDYPTPVDALNEGLNRVQTPYTMVCIDGARMLTPGVFDKTFDILKSDPTAFVYTVGFHLGKYHQNDHLTLGYNQQVEDDLLSTIDWKTNGYNLFRISSYKQEFYNFFSNVSESNCFVIETDVLRELGGFKKEFRTIGGGLINLHIFKKIIELGKNQPYCLIGEATFHQYHSGASTNIERTEHPIDLYRKEYKSITGQYFASNRVNPIYFGSLHQIHLNDIVPRADFYSFINIADSYLIRGETSKALDVLIAGSIDYPFNLKILEKIADIQLSNKKYLEAQAFLDKAFSIDASAFQLYSLQGKLFFHQNQFENAIRFFEKGLHFDPGNPKILYFLYLIYKRQNALDKADEVCNQLLLNRERLNRSHLILNVFYILLEENRIDEAISILELGTEIDEESPGISMALAKVYQKKGALDFAKKYAEKAFFESTIIEELRLAFHMNLCHFLLSLNMDELASMRLEKVSVVHPEADEPIFLIGKLKIRNEYFGDAERIFRELIDQSSNVKLVVKAYPLYIKCLMRNKQFEKANQASLELIKFQKEDPNHYFHYGHSFKGLGRLHEAITVFEKSLALGFKHKIAIYQVLVECNIQVRNKDRAQFYWKLLDGLPDKNLTKVQDMKIRLDQLDVRFE